MGHHITQQKYDEMNSDIHHTILSFEYTDHWDENAMKYSLSPMRDLSSKFGGPLHDDSFNEFVV